MEWQLSTEGSPQYVRAGGPLAQRDLGSSLTTLKRSMHCLTLMFEHPIAEGAYPRDQEEI